MYPNQPGQPTPIDYLNQISAPQAPKRSFSRNQLILFAVLGALLLFSIIAMFANSAGPNTNELNQQLAARLQTTEAIVGDAQSKIKSSKLSSLNSSLKIYLTNTNRDITTPLEKDGIKAGKINEQIAAKENGKELSEKLEDARLNAIYDRTYAREMTYQLSTIVTLMQQIYERTNDKSMKEFLDTSYKNLAPIQKEFADFSATSN